MGNIDCMNAIPPQTQDTPCPTADQKILQVDAPSVTQLMTAIELIEPVVRELKRDYPTLMPYAVMTHSGADAAIPDRISSLLQKIPEAFVDHETKKIARALVSKNHPLPQELIQALKIKPDCCLEIRFQHLDYPQIWRMQTDPRIDLTRTPQTKASIRIVLGVLDQLVSQSQQA